MRWALTCLVAMTTAGCGPTVVGEWSSTEPVGSDRNSMNVGDDFTGIATIWVLWAMGPDDYTFDFRWGEKPAGYTFEMSCQKSPYGDCVADEDNFTMVCDVGGDDENLLTCEVDEDDHNWTSYGFAWTKVED